MTRSHRRQLLAIVLAGVFVRLLFLAWVAPLEFWADEGKYAYQALAWNRFGFYLGSPGWVWPPGYPAYLAPFLSVFGESGIFAAKLGQVALSGAVGGSVVLMARRLFSQRAACLAGILWAVYLPLIGFTHYLWPETLFLATLLPALALFLGVVDGDASRPMLRTAICGGLIGIACLIKEAPLPLLVLLPAVLVLAGRRSAPDDGDSAPVGIRLGLAAVLVLSAVSVILPWSLRTRAVYGRVVPSGATLGENMFQGVNAVYVNYDYAGAPALETVGKTGRVYRWLLRPPANAERWERSTAPNTLARDAENVASGKRFAAAHPGFFLRSRIKKLADWFTPLNFYHRHHRLQIYEGSITLPWIRRPLAFGSIALTCLVLIGGIGGLFLRVPNGARRWTLLAVIVTFLSGALVVSMSRYRVPVEPLLIVLCAGFFSRAAQSPTARSRRLAFLGWGLLAALWAINAREIFFHWGRDI